MTNHEQVGKGLDLLKGGLGTFVDREFKSAYKDRAAGKHAVSTAGEVILAVSGASGPWQLALEGIRPRRGARCSVPKYDGASLSRQGGGGCTLATGLHGAVRAELQASQESTRALAARYGLNAKTVVKWRKRTSTADRPMGPSKPKSRGTR